MTRRRDVLRGLGGLALASLSPRAPGGAPGTGAPDGLSGKRALIRRSFRPPNYETPLEDLDALYTPNDAFFVRWHLAGLPQVDGGAWRLRVGGEGALRAREFSLEELRRGFEQVEIAAVNQCSGNRRGLFTPRVPGIQWGYGAMGNALWRGVRLRDVLAKAGVGRRAVEVVCDGADSAVLPRTPDFAKSLPIARALDEHTLIALDMNGAPLPHWNGFPARLVVPGWTATYWVKQLSTIRIVEEPFDGFWMKSAYRLPAGTFPASEPFDSQANGSSAPITTMVVNSLVTNAVQGQRFSLGRPIEIRGAAWDGGSGIRTVEVSTDGGRQWHAAELGADAGRFSWRRWHFRLEPAGRGPLRLEVRATSRAGEVQPRRLVANPAGYHHNVIQSLDVEII